MLAFGVWRIESMAPRRMIAILLCTCGLALIGAAAARAGLNLGLRIAALGIYSGTGGLLGATTAAISAKRHAGTILASLGMVATTGFKIVSAIGISGGMLGVVMQALDGERPSSLLLLLPPCFRRTAKWCRLNGAPEVIRTPELITGQLWLGRCAQGTATG